MSFRVSCSYAELLEFFRHLSSTHYVLGTDAESETERIWLLSIDVSSYALLPRFLLKKQNTPSRTPYSQVIKCGIIVKVNA